eukprot:496071_1
MVLYGIDGISLNILVGFNGNSSDILVGFNGHAPELNLLCGDLGGLNGNSCGVLNFNASSGGDGKGKKMNQLIMINHIMVDVVKVMVQYVLVKVMLQYYLNLIIIFLL